MRCRELHRLSERLAAGRLTDDERRAARRHADACDECRELLELATGEALRPEPSAVDLLPGVLARTGSDPCAAARPRLCARCDGEIEGLDEELVEGHLAGCDACAALCAALVALRRELPRLAEIDPGSNFTDDVLAHTSRRRLRTAAHTAPLGVRIANWLTECGAIVQRPRLAMEAAYILTLILTLLVLTPGSPLAEVPQRAFSIGRARPSIDLQRPAARLEHGVRDGVHALWSTTAVPLDTQTRRIVTRTAHVSGELGGTIRTHLGTFVNRLASNLTTNDNTGSTPEAHGDEE